MRTSKKLSSLQVAKLTKPGRYGDGDGLWLQIAAGGTKSWILRYQRAGQARQMGLGPVRDVSLAKAREKARINREMLQDEIDPIEARRARRTAKKVQAARTVTFKECAVRYIADKLPEWKNAKHQYQWAATLETYVYPKIGHLPVAAVDTTLVLEVLQPIWTSKSETAGRVRGRIEAILGWATVRGYREGDNPARLQGHLGEVLPKKNKVRAVRHQPALPYAAIGDFMAEIRERAGMSARALEFTVLTAARTGETIGAKWGEIDFAAKLWIVPGERTKSGREHRVPLSEQALDVLARTPHEDKAGADSFIFPGSRPKLGLSNMSMLKLLRDVRPGLTVHGFRSSFRDWAAEQTNFPRDIAEAALAHVLRDKTEAAYLRGDKLEKRRKLMAAWGGYCARPSSSGGSVVPIRKAGAA